MPKSALPPETLRIHDLLVPFFPRIITRRIEKPLRAGRYEKGEIQALRALLRPGDRVLELGGGLGLVSAAAALHPGVEAVWTVEANPELIPVIEKTHALNGVRGATVIHGVADGAGGGVAPFYLRRDFWASSMEPDSRPYERVVQVPRIGLGDLIARVRPDVLVCDVEGAELELLSGTDLSTLRALAVELHPKVYGSEAAARLMRRLDDGGLRLLPARRRTSVRSFERRAPPAFGAAAPSRCAAPDSRAAMTARAGSGAARPRILGIACVKDEGPFLLEWLAWHRAAGMTDFAIFTNDCTDGSELMLERAETLGLLRHMANPALSQARRGNLQAAALAYAPHLPAWREADYALSFDVDEFVNIRVGDRSFAALIDAAGPFDALSMSELVHGANGRMQFEPGLVTRQFARHDSETPGGRRAHRGVKTLVRTGPRLARMRNHRPDFAGLAEDVLWRDGSGRPAAALLEDPAANGIDCRGAYGLVSLDHFPLRSLECYLVKMARGDVVVRGKAVSRRYWRKRDRNEAGSSDLSGPPGFAAELARLRADPVLGALHRRACAARAARIAEITREQAFRDRSAWILENAWAPPSTSPSHSPAPAPAPATASAAGRGTAAHEMVEDGGAVRDAARGSDAAG